LIAFNAAPQRAALLATKGATQMTQPVLSTDIQTKEARIAQEHGYEVHHDIGGWYIVGPREWRDESGCDRKGRSLGSNSRRHFADCEDAWIVAYWRATNKARA
jgi:hypothetical protein